MNYFTWRVILYARYTVHPSTVVQWDTLTPPGSASSLTVSHCVNFLSPPNNMRVDKLEWDIFKGFRTNFMSGSISSVQASSLHKVIQV